MRQPTLSEIMMGFGAGMYSPQTRDGRRLLAHELTHIAQQSGGKGGASNPRVLQRQEAPSEPPVPDKIDDSSKQADPKSQPLIPIPVLDQLDPTVSVPNVPGVPGAIKGQALKLSYVKKALDLVRSLKKKPVDECGPPFIGFNKASSGQFQGLCCKGSDRSRQSCCNWREIAIVDNRCCTGLEAIVQERCLALRLAPDQSFPPPPPAAPPEFNDLPGSTLPPGTAAA